MNTKQVNLKNCMTRVDARFLDELNSIKESRLTNGADSEEYGDKLSLREMTKLITRHKYWNEIKRDLIDFGLGGEDEK